jgi:hypothetical protein
MKRKLLAGFALAALAAAPALAQTDTITLGAAVQLSGKDAKASLGDYIRLVQLQKELEEDEPRDIEVRWVDPEE